MVTPVVISILTVQTRKRRLREVNSPAKDKQQWHELPPGRGRWRPEAAKSTSSPGCRLGSGALSCQPGPALHAYNITDRTGAGK